MTSEWLASARQTGNNRGVAGEPSGRFWRVFGIALACYLAIGVVRAIRGGANGFALLTVVILGAIFAVWASWFPRAASLTLAILALIFLALTIFVSSSDPLALQLLLGFLSLVSAYLAFRANRVAAHAHAKPQADEGKPETTSDDS